MGTRLPQDDDDRPIPAMRLKAGGAHAVDISAVSARNATAFDGKTRVVSLYATAACFLAFGDDTVEATTDDHYFPPGIYYDVALAGGSEDPAYTHVAAITEGSSGTLYISEKE